MEQKITFQEIINKTLEVIREFEKVEKKKWGIEGAMMELSKQVGELAKNVMVFEGYYMAGRDSLPEYQTSKEKIADELSDILFMVIRIAEHYKIDLEKEHLKQLEIALNHPSMKIKKNKKNLVTAALIAVIPIGIFHDDSCATTLAVTLNFKFFYVLENVLLHPFTLFL